MCNDLPSAATTSGCSMSTSPARMGQASRSSLPTSAMRRQCATPSTASTSCTTTSPRCHWPVTRTCCARSTPTAPRSSSRRAPMPAWPRSCTPRRAPCSGFRRPTRCCRPRCPTRRRHTVTPSWRPSGPACAPPPTASTSRSCGRGRSSVTAGWASSGSSSTGSPTAPTRSSSATGRTATSSSTPTTWRRCASSPVAPGDRPCSTPALTASAPCARPSTTSAGTPAPVPRSVRSPPGRRRRRCGPARPCASLRSPRITG